MHSDNDDEDILHIYYVDCYLNILFLILYLQQMINVIVIVVCYKAHALHIEGGPGNEQLAIKMRARGVMIHATMNTLKEGN